MPIIPYDFHAIDEQDSSQENIQRMNQLPLLQQNADKVSLSCI
jgi:hypothetical protein